MNLRPPNFGTQDGSTCMLTTLWENMYWLLVIIPMKLYKIPKKPSQIWSNATAETSPQPATSLHVHRVLLTLAPHAPNGLAAWSEQQKRWASFATAHVVVDKV